MRTPLRRRGNAVLVAAGTLLLPLGVLPASSAVPAETPAAVEIAGAPSAAITAAFEAHAQTLTVAEAIEAPAGTSASVQGYVVGQPISTESVITSEFPNDYALALADSPDETDTARMLYVQIPDEFRAEYGLNSNPDGLGTALTATGTLEAYYAHDGLTSVTGFTDGEPAPDPDPDPEPEPDPEIPEGYYDEAEGKAGDELKGALHGIISESTVLSYDDAWDVLKETDEDPNNADNVILLYSGRSQNEDDHGGDVGNWNREHVWAKSHGDFGTSPGAGTDVHHLRPTDMQVNSTRSNKDFDNGGTEVDGAPGNFTDEDSWEPRDEVKGDVARMIFYMAVRYEGNGDAPDLELNDQVDNGSAPAMGRVSVLLDWHAADPPDAFEQNRNNVIFEDWQHNRNPFIDHPEWVAEIWN